MRRRLSTVSPELSRGQSLVEFAMALPVLAMLSLGAIDVGRAFVVQVSLTNAAREGARYCAAHTTESTATQSTLARVEAEMGTHVSLLDSSTVACAAVSLPDGTKTVTVAPEAVFVPVTPYAGVITGGTIRLHASATMLGQ